MSLKNPVTPPGIDPGTVRLVAQRLNHYATPGPTRFNLHICMFLTRFKGNIFNLIRLLKMSRGVENSDCFKRWDGNSSVLQEIMCYVSVVIPYKVLKLCNLKGLMTTNTTHPEIQTRVFRIYHYAVKYCGERSEDCLLRMLFNETAN
jgi:hypothetical protein